MISGAPLVLGDDLRPEKVVNRGCPGQASHHLHEGEYQVFKPMGGFEEPAGLRVGYEEGDEDEGEDLKICIPEMIESTLSFCRKSQLNAK